MNPLYREDLDQLIKRGCDAKDCDHTAHGERLFFHGRCHWGKGVSAEYLHGVLTLRCKICDTPVVAIHAAPEPAAPDNTIPFPKERKK